MAKKDIKLKKGAKEVRWCGKIPGGEVLNILFEDCSQAQLKKILAADPKAVKFIDGEAREEDKDQAPDLVQKAPVD